MRTACGLPNSDCTFAKQVTIPSEQPSAPNPKPSKFASFLSHLWPKTASPAYSLLLITFLILVSCLPAFSQASGRPETGTYIKDVDRSGYGVLIVHNNWTMDTVAVLTDKKVKPLLAVYLRSKDTLKITGIDDGNYGLYFTVGSLWDAKEGKFRSVLGYYRYNQPLQFETDDVGDEIEYSVFELDLYEARASNFLPDQFQFPDLRS
ncbi:Uncharacterised protein [uncultured archaeon]|nr:Uncharacterised protein [uncultured archaeon]